MCQMAEGRVTCSDRMGGSKTRSQSTSQVIYNLNLYLKGWWNYYGLTEGRTIFRSVCRVVWEGFSVMGSPIPIEHFFISVRSPTQEPSRMLIL